MNNVWVVFDPFTNGHRVYDLDLYRRGTTGYVSPPLTSDKAREVFLAYTGREDPRVN